MEEKTALSDITMYITEGYLVVPIQIELYDEIMPYFQNNILEKVGATGVGGVVLDFSGVNVMDSFLCKTVFDTVRAISLLGAKTVITGFKPGVVASLIDLNLDFEDIETAITIKEGLRKLKYIIEPEGDKKEDWDRQHPANEELEEDSENEKYQRETD
ncbi:MAG: STAS domain-containing protein [Candidatus Methanofastidiosia archaeon]